VEPVLLLMAAMAVVGVGIYVSWRRDQQRRAMLLQFAQGRGWRLTPSDDALPERWTEPPFGLGDHRRATNVLTGADPAGRPLVAFDYSYQTHSTDSKGNTTTQTHRFAVCALQLPAYLPRLTVTTENVLTRLGNAVGVTSDIELESEDFNRAFRVHSADPKFASDVLSPRVMETLLARRHLSWRIDGADIICWEDGRLSPAGVLEAASLLGVVVAGVPSFVWHDHGLAADPPRQPEPPRQGADL
jgi:hypothetical protein